MSNESPKYVKAKSATISHYIRTANAENPKNSVGAHLKYAEN
jgi:hypothetical protein